MADADTPKTDPTPESAPAASENDAPAAESAPAPETMAPEAMAVEATDANVGATPYTVANATVVSLGDESVRVEVDGSEADVPREELPESVAVGDTFSVWVEPSREERRKLIASVAKAERLAMFERLERAAQEDTPLSAEVIAKVNGGLSVDIGIRAFLPASQADLRPVDDLDPLLGKTFDVHILKFQAKRGNIVVTRRPVLKKERAAQRDATIAKLKVGEVVTGVVCSFTDFGAFVDVGGIDGLVHKDDLSWGRIKHPRDAVSMGQEVRVKVLEFEAAKDRLSLGYRQLQDDPWAKVEDTYEVGTRVSGKVVSLTDYGAFVELEPGIEGLIHVSEMSWTKRVRHPKEILKNGQDIDAEVLAVDLQNRRVSLGLKQTLENPWVAFADQYPKGTAITGKVTGVKEYGIFVETESGLEGLVHASDFSWTERIKDPGDLYKVGDEVQAAVIEVDLQNARLSLGIKQLTDDPWKVIAKKYPRGTKIKGKVTRIVDFGAFIEVEEGIEGLCHISQLSTDRVEKVADVAKVGAEMEVAVVDVDRKKRKVSLSVKALTEADSDYKKYMVDDEGFGNVLADKLAGLKGSDE